MEILTWSIFGFIVTIIFKAFFDQNRIEDGKKIYHGWEIFITVILCLPELYGFVVAVNLAWYFVLPIASLMMSTFYWLFFDGFLNKLRGYSIWFTGSEDGKEDAKTDNFLQKLTLKQHILVKTVPLALFILIYILMYIL